MVMRCPEVVAFPTMSERKLYFDNNKVEDLMLKYKWTGCTDVALRDKIMQNTEELIRQIIRAHNLHRIYPGQEESAFMDLFQTAWVQIERTLYKYKARIHCGECYDPLKPSESCIYSPDFNEYDILTPREVAKRKLKCKICRKVPETLIYRGTSKIFNMWSQVARTVILAYIKKENRDYKNSDTYKVHLGNKTSYKASESFIRFVDEARLVCRYNENFLSIIEALEYICATDERPYEGIINKLMKLSSQSRTQVTNFLKLIRLRSDEFTDSPINSKNIKMGIEYEDE